MGVSVNNRQAVDVMIFLVLESEHEGLQEALTGFKTKGRIRDTKEGVPYTKINLVCKNDRPIQVQYSIFPRKGELDAQTVVNKALRLWHPAYVFLIGVGGGLRDVELNDVVVGDPVVYYEPQKHIRNNVKFRSKQRNTPTDLISMLKNFYLETYKENLRGESNFSIHFEKLLTGEKTVADHNLRSTLSNEFPDAVAVEMEAAGFTKACREEGNEVRWAVVRGISDLADKHKDENKSERQKRASKNAFHFILSFLCSDFIETDQTSRRNIDVRNLEENISQGEEIEPNFE